MDLVDLLQVERPCSDAMSREMVCLRLEFNVGNHDASGNTSTVWNVSHVEYTHSTAITVDRNHSMVGQRAAQAGSDITEIQPRGSPQKHTYVHRDLQEIPWRGFPSSRVIAFMGHFGSSDYLSSCSSNKRAGVLPKEMRYTDYKCIQKSAMATMTTR